MSSSLISADDTIYREKVQMKYPSRGVEMIIGERAMNLDPAIGCSSQVSQPSFLDLYKAH